MALTNDQQHAYNELIQFINAPYNRNDYKRALIGAGGVGKTYLIRTLILNSNMSYSRIGLATPTHKASRVLTQAINIDGLKANTLASDLGLRLNFDLDNFDINNPPFDPRGRIKVGDYDLYIVDEASMINSGLFKLLEQEVKQHNVKLLYIGDDKQLPPPKEKVSLALKGCKSYTLKQIVRQDEDNPVLELCDILRHDIENKTRNFLQYIYENKSKFNEDMTKGFLVCNPMTFAQQITINFSKEELLKNVDFAKVISYRNINVSGWNKLIRNHINGDAKTVVSKDDLFLSGVSLVDKFNSLIIINSEDYIVYQVVDYTHPVYNLQGFYVKFQAVWGGKITQPLFVINHNNPETLQNYIKILNDKLNAAKNSYGSRKAQLWKEFYAFKDSCLLLTNLVDSNDKIIHKADIDYGFAVTANKAQGSTYENVFLDVNDIVYNKYGNFRDNLDEVNRRLYVGVSRCRKKLFLNFGE